MFFLRLDYLGLFFFFLSNNSYFRYNEHYYNTRACGDAHLAAPLVQVTHIISMETLRDLYM